ncbi:MAG: hypothetical protein Q7K57_14430 [Burkholderiaceae bacterium]|jgi:hypothetical protein|nr:hypothetical protein [Burkholderiaceae bacterium]
MTESQFVAQGDKQGGSRCWNELSQLLASGISLSWALDNEIKNHEKLFVFKHLSTVSLSFAAKPGKF